ncbi:MAG: putative zinc-binding metallopeptidase [Pirellulales bacterium]
MQTYRCTCGNRLYFDNSICLVCNREVGWCEGCRRITALEPANVNGGPTTEYRCSYSDCGRPLQKCHNYAVENVCNHLYVVDEALKVQGAAPAADASTSHNAAQLCAVCQLTETIPVLSVAGNREKWARLEAAKRRLIYTLDRLGLPYANATPKLSFDFKADIEHPGNEWRNAGPAEIVYTGHADGKITINIREADDAMRESLRVKFHEAHRTLIGHYHHEIGHYYWQLLVQGKREREFIQAFGDHNNPPYQDAMNAYYQKGPREGWPGNFISAYASSHPWEDFAETFALYLDMISVLDTATHLFKSMRTNFHTKSVRALVERFQEVGILVNEFNRTVGLLDLVPEVIVPPVVSKLEFIHALIKRAAKKPRIRPPAPIEIAPEPALAS